VVEGNNNVLKGKEREKRKKEEKEERNSTIMC
jgi:hypothetical protein